MSCSTFISLTSCFVYLSRVFSQKPRKLSNRITQGSRFFHSIIYYGIITGLECPWVSSFNSSKRLSIALSPLLDEARKITNQS